MIWNVVKMKCMASIQGLASVDLHLSELLWMEKMLSFCYERGKKKQVPELSSEANRFRLHPAGCAVSQHPWSSSSIHLKRLLTAVFWMRLLLPCKKEWLFSAYIAFVNIQRLLLVFSLSGWYICSTDLMENFLATISSFYAQKCCKNWNYVSSCLK